MNAKRPRALVAEDSRSWQQILGELLSDMGLTVDCANSYDSAVAALQRHTHRLAIIDLSLGGDKLNQDGLQLLAAVPRLDPNCATLLLSGYLTVEVTVSALKEYGAYTCLRKETFQRKQFRAVVQQILAVPPAVSESGLKIPPAAALTSTAPPPTVSQPVGQALVVEDDASWQDILGELLAANALIVHRCNSFGEALGYLRREQYVLAVVDLSLASSVAVTDNQDGHLVLERARAGHIPTVVVSGKAWPEEVARLYDRYDIFAYQEKQAFDRRAFQRTIATIIATYQAERDILGRLTPREAEVLDALVRGMSNKEISRALYISPNTVKRHLQAIFAKLEVNSRAAAVAKAMEAKRFFSGLGQDG